MPKVEYYTLSDLAGASGLSEAGILYHAKKMKWKKRKGKLLFTRSEFWYRIEWLRISTSPQTDEGRKKRQEQL